MYYKDLFAVWYPQHTFFGFYLSQRGLRCSWQWVFLLFVLHVILCTVCLTFAAVRVAHVVWCAVRVRVGVGSGPIHSNEFAPVHLKYREQSRYTIVIVSWLGQPPSVSTEGDRSSAPSKIDIQHALIPFNSAIKMRSTKTFMGLHKSQHLWKWFWSLWFCSSLLYCDSTFSMLSRLSGSTLCMKLVSVLT